MEATEELIREAEKIAIEILLKILQLNANEKVEINLLDKTIILQKIN